jgi:large subunit ribosomal protein L23
MNLYEVLRRPLVTEKSTTLQIENKYAFEVDKSANKPQIKLAVEKAFNVEVLAVNVVTIPGKTRRLGRRLLPAHPWKKAIVTLKPGDTIQFFEGA